MNKDIILKLLRGSDDDIRIAHNLVYASSNFELLHMKPYEGGKTRQFIWFTKLNSVIKKNPGWRGYFNSYILSKVNEYHRDTIYTEFDDALMISYRGNFYSVKLKK